MVVLMPQSEMREPTFLILLALTEGAQHGYALIGQVADLSAGRVHLRAGTLYGALERLVREGLVVETGEEVVGGRLRRYYDLSDAGAQALALEARRLRESADAATVRLAARGVLA